MKSLRGRPGLRFLDRYLGIPAVALAGLRPKRRMPADIRKIGVLRTAAIGEVLLISAILDDLRAAFPDAELTMITGEGNAEMGALVARGRCRHLAVKVASAVASAMTLRRERFDVLIDTGPWPRFDALLTAAAGARFTIGFSSRNQARHFAFDLVVPHSRELHEVENFRALIRPLNAAGSALPSLHVEERPLPATVPPGPHVVLHPWSGGFRAYLREWPLERWVELADQLRSYGATFLVSGGPADREKSRDIVNAIRVRGLKAESIAGLSITDTIPVLRHARVVVGVNTSVTHLASSLGVRTVMLHGPTSPKRWGPLGARSVNVCSAFPNCGFVHHGFEYDGQREDCMLGISVDAVAVAARSLAVIPSANEGSQRGADRD